MKYLVVIEQTESGFSAYSPDVSGCVATAKSRADVEREIADAISFHVEGMRAEGLDLPTPHASAAYVDGAGVGSVRLSLRRTGTQSAP